ncbi:uncharacterized protein PAF06_011754 [Gastrophryne carolinensis]
MGKLLLITLLVVLLAFLAERREQYNQSHNVYREIESVELPNCHLLDGIEYGSEDIAILPNGLAFISSGLHYPGLFSFAPNRPGEIFLLNLKENNPQPTVLPFTKEFDSSLFAPHGLSTYIDPNDNTIYLFVVNHPHLKSTVEIFRYSEEENVLVHLKTIKHEALYNVNDLVVLGPESFYATNDHYFWNLRLRFLESFLGLKWTNVVYYSNGHVKQVADGFYSANGIAMSNDKKFIYVADIFGKSLHVMEKHADWSLSPVKNLPFGTLVDNLSVDPVTGDIWIGAHPNGFKLFSYNAEAPPGSEVIRVQNIHSDHPIVTTVYANNGSVLQGSTVAAVWEKQLLVGTAFHKALYCKLDYQRGGFHVEVENKDLPNCQYIKGVEYGSEDLHLLPNGLAFFSSGLKVPLLKSFAPDRPAEILLVDLNQKNLQAVPLKLSEGFDVASFNPHGISVHIDEKAAHETPKALGFSKAFLWGVSSKDGEYEAGHQCSHLSNFPTPGTLPTTQPLELSVQQLELHLQPNIRNSIYNPTSGTPPTTQHLELGLQPNIWNFAYNPTSGISPTSQHLELGLQPNTLNSAYNPTPGTRPTAQRLEIGLPPNAWNSAYHPTPGTRGCRPTPGTRPTAQRLELGLLPNAWNSAYRPTPGTRPTAQRLELGLSPNAWNSAYRPTPGTRPTAQRLELGLPPNAWNSAYCPAPGTRAATQRLELGLPPNTWNSAYRPMPGTRSTAQRLELDGTVFLFVVNHPSPEFKTKIEIFKFVEEKNLLVHVRSIVHPGLQSINDLVAVGPESFYATNDSYFHNMFLKFLEMFLGLTWTNIVYYSPLEVREVVSGLHSANGMAMSQDKKFIYAVDLTAHTINVYKRNPNWSLSFVKEFDCGTLVDNLWVDPDTGDIWTGAHPNLFKVFNYKDEDPPGSEVIRVQNIHSANPIISRVYVNNGSVLQGSSCAAIYKGKMIVGTVFHKALYCPWTH